MYSINKSARYHVFAIKIIFIISIFFVFDLFVHKGRPVTFDAPTHMANMAQVYGGLKDGDFPVRWGAGWARYGWPAPLFAQQTTSYIGGVLQFITQDIVTSHNLTVLIGAFLSTLLMYILLRFYTGFIPAVTGAILFHFAPYRIMNVYIRGALPEFYASIFILTIMISLYISLHKKNYWGYVGVALSIAGLLLTHPFMLVVGSFLIVPYFLYLLFSEKKHRIKSTLLLVFMSALGAGIAGYFLIPLFLEVKYLYYGSSTDHFVRNHFLSLSQFLIEWWPYFMGGDIAPRAHFHLGGMIEGAILILSAVFLLYRYIRYKKIETFHLVMLGVGMVYICFMLPFTQVFYEKITLLGNVQHPWRMLTGYIFIPPLLCAFILNQFKHKQLFVAFLIVLTIAFLRFPQLYGKNYTTYPQESYFVTDDNMHATILNTIWMGDVRDYPYQKTKIKIFEGKGTIQDVNILNAKRSFYLNAETPVKVVDYTFYFPGWKTFVDGVEIPIQFQDPEFRGVITFEVPAGNHTVETRFTRTKPRILGEIVTLISLCTLVLIIIFRKQISIRMSKKLPHFL